MKYCSSTLRRLTPTKTSCSSFFAGHGHFNEIFKEGYLVLQDTQSCLRMTLQWEAYLSHSEFRNIVDRMSCKHILLALDTCYSGTFDERIAMRGELSNLPEELSNADVQTEVHIQNPVVLDIRSQGASP